MRVYRHTAAFVAAAAASTAVLVGGAAPSFGAPATSSQPAAGAVTTQADASQLASEFAEFTRSTPGLVSLSVTAAGGGTPISLTSSGADAQSLPAWGTIRLPLALAATRSSGGDTVNSDIQLAVGASDTTAAGNLIQSLGGGLPDKINSVLSSLGSPRTHVESASDYTGLARTPWAVPDQSVFGAHLLCAADRSVVTSPMLATTSTDPASSGSVPSTEQAAETTTEQASAGTTAEQVSTAGGGGQSTPARNAWGLQDLASSGDVQFLATHGGWGPADGQRYLARQLALVQTPRGLMSVALAAEPTTDGQDAAMDLAKSVSHWLTEHLGEFGAGFCNAGDAQSAADAGSTSPSSTAAAGTEAESSVPMAGEAGASSPATSADAGATAAEAVGDATTPTTQATTSPSTAPSSAAATSSSAPPATPAPAPAPAAQLVAPNTECRPTVVAVDPGHSTAVISDFDPVSGVRMADWSNGNEDKDVLTVAQTVQRLLQAIPGYKVVLTKNSLDERVTYRQRVDRAVQAGAVIGVSIHTSPNDNAIFPQRQGLYREGPDANGTTKRVSFGNQETAARSQLFASKFQQTRGAAEGHAVQVRDNSFSGRSDPAGNPLWSGNIPMMSLLADTVPWVYNEFGPATGGGGGTSPIAADQLTKYAQGIVDGVRASTPPAQCATAAAAPSAAPAATSAAPATPAAVPGRTACRRVVQIGDSTSVAVDDPSAIPNASDRLTAQLKRVGATEVTLDASSGRSIAETVNGNPNAVDGVNSNKGKADCWIIAMGVNDAVAVSGGSQVGDDERINRIMAAADGKPVLWPTIAVHGSSNPNYTPEAVDKFNAALRAATDRFPNLAVYDWRGAAQPAEWWSDDGIHYTGAGYIQRNIRFADALAIAYPTGQAPPAVKWVPA